MQSKSPTQEPILPLGTRCTKRGEQSLGGKANNWMTYVTVSGDLATLSLTLAKESLFQEGS